MIRGAVCGSSARTDLRGAGAEIPGVTYTNANSARVPSPSFWCSSSVLTRKEQVRGALADPMHVDRATQIHTR